MIPPYLEKQKWPSMKDPSERIVKDNNSSEIEQDEPPIEDHINEMIEELCCEEIMSALHEGDVSKLRESLIALIQHIKSSEDLYAAS